MPISADIRVTLTTSGGYAQTGWTQLGPDFDTSLQDHADAAREAFVKEWLPACSIIWGLSEVRASESGQTAFNTEPDSGDAPVDATMLSTCLLVSKVPNNGPPGRMYLPACTEATTTAQGRVSPAALANYQGRADDFLDDLADVGFSMVMRRFPGDVFDLVPRLRVHPYVGRQDRRLIRSRR